MTQGDWLLVPLVLYWISVQWFLLSTSRRKEFPRRLKILVWWILATNFFVPVAYIADVFAPEHLKDPLSTVFLFATCLTLASPVVGWILLRKLAAPEFKTPEDHPL